MLIIAGIDIWFGAEQCEDEIIDLVDGEVDEAFVRWDGGQAKGGGWRVLVTDEIEEVEWALKQGVRALEDQLDADEQLGVEFGGSVELFERDYELLVEWEQWTEIADWVVGGERERAELVGAEKDWGVEWEDKGNRLAEGEVLE